MRKDEILMMAENIFKQFSQTCGDIKETIFFERPEGKWSVAENMQHLIISTKTTSLAYKLPKILLRLVGGKPNRFSKSFEELSAGYYKKLEDGAKASGRYIPKPIEIKYGKAKLLDNWNKTTAEFICALKNNRTEADLDHYQVKHPLLGSITLRELCYFTIFHADHHLKSITKRTYPNQ